MAWCLRALTALVVPRFGSQHPHWADASDLCGQLHLSAHTHGPLERSGVDHGVDSMPGCVTQEMMRFEQ